MNDEIVQVNFRMPLALKNQLESAAKERGRSITSELVTRLEQSFAEEKEPVPMNVMFDDEWLAGSGLTKAEFGTFVRMAVQSNVAQYKVDNKDD